MEQAWSALVRGQRRGPLAALARCGLRIASWPYAAVVHLRNTAYDRGWKRAARVPVPVVSIGNLTLGGTGKTPCVEYVARFYRELGVRVVILSRGYGSDGGLNDEAEVLEENLPDVPHLQGVNRAELATLAVEELEAELVVLDDGFQHRRLYRDWDVVLIDASRPPERDALFPRGTLREPVGSLRRAGAVLLTRCDQVPTDEVRALQDRLRRRFPRALLVTSEHRPVALLAGPDEPAAPAEVLTGRAVLGFCGIGNPEGFRLTLERLGARVVDFRAYPDHYPYRREDVTELARWAASAPGEAWLVTTQKDWVKLRLPELGGRPLRSLRIALAFREGQEAFDAALRRLVPVGDGA